MLNLRCWTSQTLVGSASGLTVRDSWRNPCRSLHARTERSDNSRSPGCEVQRLVPCSKDAGLFTTDTTDGFWLFVSFALHSTRRSRGWDTSQSGRSKPFGKQSSLDARRSTCRRDLNSTGCLAGGYVLRRHVLVGSLLSLVCKQWVSENTQSFAACGSPFLAVAAKVAVADLPAMVGESRASRKGLGPAH